METHPAMIERIEFKNFKVLRDTTLPLGRFTLIVGPNGSGKSTALQALKLMRGPADTSFDRVATKGVADDVQVSVVWSPDESGRQFCTTATWHANKDRGVTKRHCLPNGKAAEGPTGQLEEQLQKIRFYSLDPHRIAEPVQLAPSYELQTAGFGLAGLLDRLRDKSEERWDALNQQLSCLLPEYDAILFDVPEGGKKSFSLRTTTGHEISAKDLSDGTLMALAILALAYFPDPPPVVAFEDPDHGLHPRLLPNVQDSLYRLAFPENFGESRPPVQVIATTHSPYFLDLFKEFPEQVVIAHKQNGDAVFERLSEQPDIRGSFKTSPTQCTSRRDARTPRTVRGRIPSA
jgi:predicted ATPase